jgi:hypothetical protein
MFITLVERHLVLTGRDELDEIAINDGFGWMEGEQVVPGNLFFTVDKRERKRANRRQGQ